MKYLQIGGHNNKNNIKYAMVDDEDYEKLNKYNWLENHSSSKHTFYGYRNEYEKIDNKWKVKERINLHRFIMGLDSYKIDKRIINHIDGNGLNNQKSNLEICNHQYNSQSFRQPNRICKYAYYENDAKRKCKWRADIKINGKNYRKRFNTKEECLEFVNNIKKQYI